MIGSDRIGLRTVRDSSDRVLERSLIGFFSTYVGSSLHYSRLVTALASLASLV